MRPANFKPDNNFLTDKKFWKEFKQKNPEYKHLSIKELRENIEGFFLHAANTLVDSEHGILLNGLGYFANAVFDKKNVVAYKNDKETDYNFSTNGWIYISYIFPTAFKKNPFHHWSFKLDRKAARQMAQKIRKGVRYKCHTDMIKSTKQKYFHNDR